jgi:hypothetical protein
MANRKPLQISPRIRVIDQNGYMTHDFYRFMLELLNGVHEAEATTEVVDTLSFRPVQAPMEGGDGEGFNISVPAFPNLGERPEGEDMPVASADALYGGILSKIEELEATLMANGGA